MHSHFTDWLKFVRKLGWTEEFIRGQVTSAMKNNSTGLEGQSIELLRMTREPHNITHMNVYAIPKG